MHFDLTDLRLFLSIVETGSITAGSSRCGLALASASARVRSMEAQAGVTLLERGRRGVGPTSAGRALQHHARLVTQQMERMRGELGEYAAGLKGHVRLLANTAATAEFLPEALARFLATHPQVDLDLDERPSQDIARAVAEGEADAGVVADHIDLAGLQAFPYARDRLVLAVPARHPLAHRNQVPFVDALGSDFVGFSSDSALHHLLASHASRAGRPMRLRVRVRGLDATCRMVRQGAGIAVVPEAAARRWTGDGQLKVVMLEDAWATRRLVVIVRHLDGLPRHARLLVEHLCRRAQAED